MAGGVLPRVRGVEKSQESREDFLYRDTRSVVTKFRDWALEPANLTSFLFSIAVITVFVPAGAFYLLIFSAGFFWWGLTRGERSLFKLPKQAGILDPNELNPKDRSAQMADGIFYLGNDMVSGKELWFTNSDCRQHFLVLGTTGSGKTELLLSFAANALSWGSGFLFCDGKGDVALFAKAYALCRLHGREDDLLTLNFMTGNTDVGAGDPTKRSNTLNPFATGSSDSLTQMMVSLMDDAGGDGAMWKGRATAMFTGVMRALVWLRDQGRVDMNIGLIRQFLLLQRIIELATSDQYNGMPQTIRNSVSSYLTSLPGYKDGAEKQSQTTLDQHGYLEMQFTKILGSLADVYGHIFMTPYGEVDMYDVVVNRRVLVIMLPALEKSPDEIANLGKIVIATVKGMMGQTLGSSIEGNWQGIVERRPTSSPVPYITIFDEAGYYMTDGMAMMFAQARSLGFSLTIATQDLPSLERRNEKEAASIIANTSTKVFMKTEEPDKTARLAIAVAGKTRVSRMDRFNGTAGEIGMNYRDTMDARVEEVDAVHGTDLRAQISGEMHVFFADQKVRAKGFYAAPEQAVDKSKLKLRTNSFIPVPRPSPDQLERVRIEPGILKRLLAPDFADKMIEAASVDSAAVKSATNSLNVVISAMNELRQTSASLSERAACAIAAAVNTTRLGGGSAGPVNADLDDDDAPQARRGGISDLMDIPGLNHNDQEDLLPIHVSQYDTEELARISDDFRPHGVVIDDDNSKMVEMGSEIRGTLHAHRTLDSLDTLVRKGSSSDLSADEVEAQVDLAIKLQREGSDTQPRSARDHLEAEMRANMTADATVTLDKVIRKRRGGVADDEDEIDLTSTINSLFGETLDGE